MNTLVVKQHRLVLDLRAGEKRLGTHNGKDTAKSQKVFLGGEGKGKVGRGKTGQMVI